MDLSKHLEKASEAVKRRNYGFAVKLYSQLLAIQPGNGPARSGLREALFKKADQRAPSKPLALLLGGPHLLMAKLMGLLKQHGGAAAAYERFLKLDPLAEGANLGLARALDAAGHSDGALAVYQAYAEREPRCLEASRAAGRLLYESGDLDSALTMYEQALKVDPRDQESVRARKNLAAEGALKKSGLTEAESSRDLMRDADEQKKQEKKSRLQLTEDEIDAELEELEQKLQSDAQDLSTLKRLAELHSMRRDPQAALDCLEIAVSVAPEDPDLATRVSDLRLRVQEQRVREAEARGDDAAAAQCRKVLAEMKVGEFRRRVERQPNDLGLRFDLGEALFESGQSDEAITELQKAVLDPRRQTQARFLLGRAFHQKGLLDLAKKQLSDALSSGSLDSARQNAILYELGSVTTESGDHQAALDYFGRILETDFGFRDTAQKVESLRAEIGG